VSTDEANALLMSGGVKAFQFTKIGDTVRGPIVTEPKVEDCYKMRWDAGAKRWERTDELDKWPSGETKKQIVLVVQTDERVDADDDGRRTVYIHSRIQGALRDAVRAAGAPGIAEGGTIAVRWSSGAGTQDGGPKVYDCAYLPPPAPTVDPGGLLGNNGNGHHATPTAQAPPAAQQQPLLAEPALPPPPPGVDAEKWRNLPPEQRAAVLAALAPAGTSPAHNEPPF
jgi:hypothetical protein